MACFVPGTENRRKVRSWAVLNTTRPSIKRFIREAYGEKITSIKPIRQITLNRVVYLVNDKYFVKVFRNVTNKQLKDFEFLANYIRPFISVDIPRVVVDRKHAIYACKKVNGRSIYEFSRDEVLQYEKKLLKQLKEIIEELQSIDVKKIPNYERYMYSMQLRTKEKPTSTPTMLLAHFDLNESNFLYDKDMNIIAIID
ncbi:MAG: hypothetical protein LBF37_02275, partial [Rickettsiales bacterium]|nr:hypothetical protein [Rickettsiales bacterium]